MKSSTLTRRHERGKRKSSRFRNYVPHNGAVCRAGEQLYLNAPATQLPGHFPALWECILSKQRWSGLEWKASLSGNNSREMGTAVQSTSLNSWGVFPVKISWLHQCSVTGTLLPRAGTAKTPAKEPVGNRSQSLPCPSAILGNLCVIPSPQREVTVCLPFYT